MICPTCRYPEALVAQPCPGCGNVAVLPGDRAPGTATDHQPTLILPGEPTIAFAAPSAPEPSSVPPGRRRGGRGVLIALIGVLAVALIGGGAAFAGWKLGWFGGAGRAPYEALPQSALAYSQVDLNPAVDQKLAAYTFFRELPEFANAANPTFDLREVLWNEWAKTEDTHGLSYATDIKPWLGQRAGVAWLPSSTGERDPSAAIAIEVTDERAAVQTLPKLLGSDAAIVTMLNGYAVITAPDAVEAVKAELAKGTLSQNPTFTGDLAKLGATGFAMGWADFTGLSSVQHSQLGKGRTSFALRFTNNTLEWAGSVVGLSSADLPPAIGGTDLVDLPADTAAAISVQGGGAWVAANWERIKSSVPTDSLTSMGWNLPDDLVAVLGSQATLAAGPDLVEAITDLSSGSGQALPSLGLRLSTDQGDRVKELVGMSDPTGILQVRTDAGTVTVATTDIYASQLNDPSAPKLAGVAKFTAVVPEASKSVYAAYVDFTPFAGLLDQLPAEYADQKPFLKALTSAGMSVVPSGDGATWSLRIARS